MESTDAAALRAQLTILAIFRELGCPVGDVVSIGEITRAWPRYAMRANDLPPALKRLMADGRLVLEPGSQDVLTLTVDGERWMRRQAAESTCSLPVRRSRRARSGARSPAVGRRHDDPVPQHDGC